MFAAMPVMRDLLPNFALDHWRPLTTAGGAMTVTTTWANDAHHHKDAETIFGKTGAKFDAILILPTPLVLAATGDYHNSLQVIVSDVVISTTDPLFTTQLDAGKGAMEIPLGITKRTYASAATTEVLHMPIYMETHIGRYLDVRLGAGAGDTSPTATVCIWARSKRPV